MFDYVPLRAGILKQAAKDYKTALRKRDLKKISELERFFLGDWGQLLSDYNGEYIIETCKKIVKEEKKLTENSEMSIDK